MTDTVTATIRRHVEAITHMLLGNRPMKPGLAIAAGQILNPAGVHRIAELAHQSNTDVIHLDFAINGGIATLRDIIIAAPRDHNLHVHTGCQLTQRPGDRRAVIMPSLGCRGHFRIQPREIVHVDAQPHDLFTTGVGLAAERLRNLVRKGADVNGQIVVHELVGQG